MSVKVFDTSRIRLSPVSVLFKEKYTGVERFPGCIKKSFIFILIKTKETN